MPPPRRFAQPVTDLVVRQRGERLRLEFTHPKSTVAGLPLAGLDSVVLLELVRPAPPEGQPLLIAPPELAGARPVLELAGAAFGDAIVGDRVRLDLPLPSPLPEPPQARAYTVRTIATGGELSAFSNIAALVPRLAPEAPAALEAKPLANGIELRWEASPGATAGYALLRRPPERADWGAPLALVEAGTTSYLDGSVRYGERYVYSVMALAAREPAIESAPRAEREVDYQDRFAPASPTGLRAAALPGEVRLLWEASPESDLAGYRLERAGADGVFAPVGTALLTALEHTDTGLVAGATYRYRLVAVDRSGNASAPGEPVEARLP